MLFVLAALSAAGLAQASHVNVLGTPALSAAPESLPTPFVVVDPPCAFDGSGCQPVPPPVEQAIVGHEPCPARHPQEPVQGRPAEPRPERCSQAQPAEPAVEKGAEARPAEPAPEQGTGAESAGPASEQGAEAEPADDGP